MLDVQTRVTALTFPAIDNPDWDHARTRRLALRTTGAEWTQSCVTQREADSLYYHRTDFAYEGLLCLVGGENWKMVDRVGIGVLVDRKPYALTPTTVEATPDWVAYHFTSEHGPFVARYRILDIAEPDGSHASVWVGEYGFTQDAPPGEVLIDLKPLVDIRHMYYFSDPEGYSLKTVESRLVTVHNDRWLAMGADSDFAWVPERHGWDLLYRMGAGNRELVDGRVCFRREYFRGVVLGRIRFAGPKAHLFLAAGATEAEASTKIQHATVLASTVAQERTGQFEKHMDKLHGRATELPGKETEIATRAYVMAERFGMTVSGQRVPESGGWWFRTPWFMSIFAGLQHNWRTLQMLGRTDMIEGAVRLALRYQHPETGQLPNRVPELKSHQDQWADSGKLPAEYYQGPGALIHMFAFLADAEHVLPADLRPEIREAFLRAYRGFKAGDVKRRQGTPVLQDNGLLTSLPSYGWMAGRRIVWAEGLLVRDLPIRVDRQWQVEDILKFRDSRYAWDLYQYPTYYLPEVNAMWIRMLDLGIRVVEDPQVVEELRQVRRKAIDNFKPLFWNPGVGYLYNLVTRDGRVDPMVTSCGLEAVGFLGSEAFSPQDLEQMWATVRAELLVTRHHAGRPAAFGVIAKDSGERVFLGDDQYHEAVCWPRETPYLVGLLRAIGQEEVVRQLLLTNLDHMQDEAVVFYANEILSLPEGVNPSPNPATCHDPVPVKNPMQWGSLWCDPYLFSE